MSQPSNIFTYHGHAIEIDPVADSNDDGDIPHLFNVAALRASHVEDQAKSYYLPSDEEEQHRLNFQYEMSVLLLDGRPGSAPVKSPRHVLDIGTGTGIWALDYAKQHPDCEVIGSDIIDRQIQKVSNFSFALHDAEHDEWAFGSKFDYIHLGWVVTCFDDTRTVMRKAFDNLRPGGYIEFFDVSIDALELDGSMRGTQFRRWLDVVNQGAQSVGRDVKKSRLYAEWLREVGFEDVSETHYALPCGLWMKDAKMKTIGRYWRQNMLGLVRAFHTLAGLAGLSDDEVAKLEEDTKQDMYNPNIHMAAPIVVTYGRKPAN